MDPEKLVHVYIADLIPNWQKCAQAGMTPGVTTHAQNVACVSL